MNRYAGVLLLLPAAALGCASLPVPGGGPGDGAEIQAQLFKLQKDAARTLEKLEKIEAGGAATAAPNATCAQAALKVEDLERQVKVLQEQILAGQRRLDEVLAEVRAGRRTAAPAPAAPSPEEQPRAAENRPAATPSSPLSGSPENLFNAAYADYSRRHFDLALAGFEAVVRADPKGPLADDAQLWVGETLSAMGRTEEAVAAYDRLIQDYPTGDKVPAAFLKKGLAQFEARRTAEAVETLKTLILRWPDADEARIAREHFRRRGITP